MAFLRRSPLSRVLEGGREPQGGGASQARRCEGGEAQGGRGCEQGEGWREGPGRGGGRRGGTVSLRGDLAACGSPWTLSWGVLLLICALGGLALAAGEKRDPHGSGDRRQRGGSCSCLGERWGGQDQGFQSQRRDGASQTDSPLGRTGPCGKCRAPGSSPGPGAPGPVIRPA